MGIVQTAASPDEPGTAEWESEGGSLFPPQVPLPPGVTSAVFHRFFVGPYTYSNLPDALEELARQTGEK